MREEQIVCQIINIRQERIVDENGITYTTYNVQRRIIIKKKTFSQAYFHFNPIQHRSLVGLFVFCQLPCIILILSAF